MAAKSPNRKATPVHAKAASQFEPDLQAKLDAFCETHGTTPEKVIPLAVSEWLADYDRGRWPHSHSLVEPSPELVEVVG